VSTETLPLQSEVHYQYLKVPEFPLTEGSILFFPFDQYSSSGSVVCRYTNLTKCAGTCETNKNNTSSSNVCSCDTSTCSGLLNYQLAVSQNFVGFFVSSSTVTKPSVANQSFTYYNTESFTYEAINIPSIKPAVVTVNIVRAPVNIVFPLYFAFLMWVTVCANIGFSVEYYLGLRGVTTAALAIGAISLLFALPSIRNTMPGSPPVGVALDFFSYFWCLVWASFGLAYLSHGFIRYALSPGNVKHSLAEKKLIHLKNSTNKALEDLSVEEVAALLTNTGRGHLTQHIRDLGVEGKLMTFELEKLGIPHNFTPIEMARYKQDLERWKNEGLDLSLLEIEKFEQAVLVSDGDTVVNLDIDMERS
jgi:hypothetical protein